MRIPDRLSPLLGVARRASTSPAGSQQAVAVSNGDEVRLSAHRPRAALKAWAALCLVTALSGCASVGGFVAGPVHRAAAALVPAGTCAPVEPGQRVDDQVEDAILKQSNQPACLLDLHTGQPGRSTVVTIHGIHGSPVSLEEVAQTAGDRGHAVKTLLYDDQHSRLTKVSRDLAESIAAWRGDHPGDKLTLVAHSMGARIAVGALHELARTHRLSEGEYQLYLVCPTLDGYPSANMAELAFDWMERFPDIAPSRDMGDRSAFQRLLEATHPPANVKTTILLGAHDDVVDWRAPGFQTIATNLRAEVVTFDGGHSNIGLPVSRILDFDPR